MIIGSFVCDLSLAIFTTESVRIDIVTGWEHCFVVYAAYCVVKKLDAMFAQITA